MELEFLLKEVSGTTQSSGEKYGMREEISEKNICVGDRGGLTFTDGEKEGQGSSYLLNTWHMLDPVL